MREDIILKALQHTGEAPDEERFRQEITGVLTRLAREEETGTREMKSCTPNLNLQYKTRSKPPS